MKYAFAVLCALTGLASPVHATTINFDAQAAGSGGFLTGIPNSPLTIGIATFTGGELRDGEAGLGADTTGVYATQGLFGSGETNPLTITFSAPVTAFSVLVVNGDDARSYSITDNAGDSFTESLPSAGAMGAAVFSLPGAGISAIQITSANTAAWDFAIDDVSFRPQAAPEPASIVLLLSGASMMAWRARRSLQSRSERVGEREFTES